MKQKGFSLIELLVVIAIIGILASVVLTSLNSARKKGQDGKVKSQVAQIAAAAAIYYDSNNGSYGPAASNCSPSTTVFNTNMWNNQASSMSTYASNPLAGTWPGTIACNSDLQSYAFAAQLASSTNTWFCTDSTGITKTITSATAPALTGQVCP